MSAEAAQSVRPAGRAWSPPDVAGVAGRAGPEALASYPAAPVGAQLASVSGVAPEGGTLLRGELPCDWS